MNKRISVGIVMSLCLAAITFVDVFAEGVSLPGGNPLAGCLGFGATSPQGYYAGTCSGVSWRYYDLTDPADIAYIRNSGGNADDINNVVMPSLYDGHANGITVRGCGPIGGFYYLGFEKHQSGQYLNQHVGSLTNDVIARNAAKLLSDEDNGFRGLDGIQDPDFVHEEFEDAKRQFGFAETWNNVGAFCARDPDDEPDAGEATGEFSVKSVAIALDNDGPLANVDGSGNKGYKGSSTNPQNKKKSMITFATDQQTTKVIFRHRIYYDNSIRPDQISNPKNVNGNIDRSAIRNEICTEWSSRRTATKGGNAAANRNSNVKSGESFCTNNNDAHNGEKVLEQSVNVVLNPGESQKVCENIKLKAQTTKIKVTWDITDTGRTDDDGRTIWDATSVVTRKGQKKIADMCVMVYRTKDPWNPDNPNAPDPQGPSIVDNESVTDFLSVGEGVKVGWNAKVFSNTAFQLQEFKAIAYQVKANQLYKDEVNKVKKRYNGDGPCKYIQENLFPGSVMACVPIAEGLSDNKIYTDSEDLVVSNSLGTKYCNTVGFKFQYRYRIQEDGQGGWQDQAGRNHWFIPKSVCRTIAKKPNVAVWNGSLYAAGKITGVTSDRFEDAALRVQGDGGITEKKILFGSWVEYLAVAGNSLKNFASGSTLYKGSGTTHKIDKANNSALTITNTSDTLGNSEISADTGIAARLISMLSKSDDKTNVQDVTAIDATTISNADAPGVTTKVFRSTSDIEIKDNIEISGTYNDPNDVPMYVIIVEGGGKVKVKSNVTRIDAWIIAPDATLDTCSEFVAGIASPLNQGTPAQNSNAGTAPNCAKQLIFNGPVIAKNAQLKRTYGAEMNTDIGIKFDGTSGGNSRSQPAEIFNYRLDSYLWAMAQSSRYGSTFNEGYISELVPRQ